MAAFSVVSSCFSFRIGLHELVPLGLQGIVSGFHARERLLLGRPVRRSNRFGTFEGHVLEHVRKAGFAFRIVHRPGIHVGMKRHYRRFMPLEHDKVQAVGKRELGDALFEFREILRRERSRQRKREEEVQFHCWALRTI